MSKSCRHGIGSGPEAKIFISTLSGKRQRAPERSWMHMNNFQRILYTPKTSSNKTYHHFETFPALFSRLGQRQGFKFQEVQITYITEISKIALPKKKWWSDRGKPVVRVKGEIRTTNKHACVFACDACDRLGPNQTHKTPKPKPTVQDKHQNQTHYRVHDKPA